MIKCHICRTKNKFRIDTIGTIDNKPWYLCHTCKDKFRDTWEKENKSNSLEETK